MSNVYCVSYCTSRFLRSYPLLKSANKIAYKKIAAMSSTASLNKLESNEANAAKLLETVKKEFEDLKKLKTEHLAQALENENVNLRQEVDKALKELVRLETLNGVKQIPIPGQNNTGVNGDLSQRDQKKVAVQKDQSEAAQSDVNQQAKESKKEKKPKEEKKPKAAVDKAPATVEAPVDVGRLDLRIGKIVEVQKHPDADSLYVEKIDCGEAALRTVVSGLVNHIPIEEMQNRIVMVLCNLKPVKMRGITSEAMVMCASSPDKVEVLNPPPGAVPGDLVHCNGFPRMPDAQLNPKKKIFETCAPDLLTNDIKEACFKGVPLMIPGKGAIVSQTLLGVNVR